MADPTPRQQSKSGLQGSGRKKLRSAPADGSYFLNECATYLNRVSRVFLLQGVSLPSDSPPLYRYTNINSLDDSKYPPCKAVNARRFYKAWNRHSLGEFEDKQEQRLPIPGPPLVFDKFGRLYEERFLAANFARIVALNMPSSCKDIRAALAQCLQESDCVMIDRNKPSDCLRSPLLETMPTKCQQLKKGYGECKRGMVDMRKRFRGNQPIAVSKELEGGAQERGHMLYAGKPAFADTAKQTAGNEPIERDWRKVENEKYRKGE